MKFNIKNFVIALFVVSAVGCTQDFEQINQNPNLPTDVGPSNLLSSIIFDPINPNINMQMKLASQVMQYFVWTNENAFDVYNFGGDAAITDAVWSANYAALRNSIDMVSKADGDNGYLAAAKILDAYHLAILTDIWRNVPNTQAGQGLDNVQPAYDEQSAIWGDILSKLEEANTMLSGSGTMFGQGGDVLFNGDAMMWRKMANSLRLKYLMRLSNAGVYANAQSEFETIVNDATTYPIITSNADQSVFDITGSAPNVSDFANITTLSGITISQRFVDQLGNGTPADYTDDDPRMDFFCRMRADGSDAEATARATGFVGAVSGSNEIDAKTVAEEDHSTKLRPMFQDNKGLLDFAYIAHAELQFILAEAALKGWNVPSSAEMYFENGVTANLDYWGIAMPAGFMMRSDIALDGIGTSDDDKLERLMEQKWIAGFGLNIFDMWGDYKRTGKPTLDLGPEVTAKGFTAAPNRMFYPVIETQINSANHSAASSAIGGDEITVKHFYQN